MAATKGSVTGRWWGSGAIVLGLTLVTLAAFVVLPLGWMTTWKLSGELNETNARRQAELAAKLREQAAQETTPEGD